MPDHPDPAPDLAADLARARQWLSHMDWGCPPESGLAALRVCDAVERLQRLNEALCERIAAAADVIAANAVRNALYQGQEDRHEDCL